jgi:hypothetical protein
MLLDKTRPTEARGRKARLSCAIAGVAALAWTAGHTPALLAFTNAPSPRMALPVPAIPAPEIKTPPSATPRLIAQAAPPQMPTPRPPANADAAPPVVLVPVTVTDPQGRWVIGLNQENFRIFEDDVEHPVSYFREINESVSLGVVSQSATGLLTLPIQEELVQLQHAVPVQVQFIEMAEPGLSLEDAAGPAMNRIRQAPTGGARKVVLMLEGNGDPGISSYTQAGVTVISVPRGTNDAVQTIAPLLTGNSYELGYTPLDHTADGKYRHIRVSLGRIQGLPAMKVSFRTGYYATEKAPQ